MSNPNDSEILRGIMILLIIILPFIVGIFICLAVLVSYR
jgi:hypothetical protein